MRCTETDCAREARDHIAAIRRHITRQDLDDDTVADAVGLRLAAAIDTLAHLPEPTRMRVFGPDRPWTWSTRNRIVHGYVFVDREIIAETVRVDLPGVEAACRRLLDG